MRSTVDRLRRVTVERHVQDGILDVFSAAPDAIPFPIRRVFVISEVSAGGVRGNHAHLGCTQLLACLAGTVTVTIYDAARAVSEVLTRDEPALLIPPMLWNSVHFAGPSTVLAVFCDELYDPADYLTDWDGYCALQAA